MKQPLFYETTIERMASYTPSLSMIVTVAVDGVPGSIPAGGSKVTVKVSFPSRAIGSSVTMNSTQASVAPAANEAVRVSGTKSPLSAICMKCILWHSLSISDK